MLIRSKLKKKDTVLGFLDRMTHSTAAISYNRVIVSLSDVTIVEMSQLLCGTKGNPESQLSDGFLNV